MGQPYPSNQTKNGSNPTQEIGIEPTHSTLFLNQTHAKYQILEDWAFSILVEPLKKFLFFLFTSF